MRESELVSKSKWDRTGSPYPIREVIKEVACTYDTTCSPRDTLIHIICHIYDWNIM
eukprot:SAG22_NODE_230_length_14595_cov_50.767660_17_plen_56_part_00